MKNTEVQNLIRLMHNAFNGSAWHGPAVFKILEDVDEKTAFKKFENIHSIAELVEHMTGWKRFALERLLGNHQYEVNEKVDWKKFEKQDLETWNQIKDQLLKTHNMLLSSLEKMTDHKLSELVENKAYDY